MSTIKIETLTAVHIGSGETLHYGTDFLRGEHEGRSILSIVDLKKVMELIKPEHVQDWVTCIEDGESTDVIVQRYKPDATMADYSKRMISDCANDKESDSLKTQIHDGFGRPYIPGSSIKGAIRTAIVATLAEHIEQKEEKIDKTKRNFQGNPIPDKKGKIQLKANAKNIEAELFGFNPKMENVDPNKDIFRFLQVGDAFFEGLSEVAIRLVNVNERKKQGFWDESKSQLIEAISPEDEAEFQLKLNCAGYNFSRNKVNPMPDCMSSIPKLFKTINAHTQKLLQDEIEYWKERKSDNDSNKVSVYIEKISNILSIVEKCVEEKECVLRIGQGSGWRFITGAWMEDLENFDDLVVPISRHDNYKYLGYDFPKTRRVDDQCELLGFVKLSIKEETA